MLPTIDAKGRKTFRTRNDVQLTQMPDGSVRIEIENPETHYYLGRTIRADEWRDMLFHFACDS